MMQLNQHQDFISKSPSSSALNPSSPADTRSSKRSSNSLGNNKSLQHTSANQSSEPLELFSPDILSHHQQIQDLEDPMGFVFTDDDLLHAGIDHLSSSNTQQSQMGKKHQFTHQQPSNHHFQNQQYFPFKLEDQGNKMKDYNGHVLDDVNTDILMTAEWSPDFMNDSINHSFLKSDLQEFTKPADSTLKQEPIDFDMFLSAVPSIEPSTLQGSTSNHLNNSINNNNTPQKMLDSLSSSATPSNPSNNSTLPKTTGPNSNINNSPDSGHKSSSPSIKSHISSPSSTSLSSSGSISVKKEKIAPPSSSSRGPKNDSDITPPSYMPDFVPSDWNDTSNLKYSMVISDAPPKSRVETQIKIAIDLYPPPPESIVHLPADTISKPKLQLRDPFTPIPTALSIDTIVVCVTDSNRYVNMCRCCLNRERKRAFRKKVRLPVEEAHWSLDQEKRAIVFNCKEIVDFGSIVDINVDGKQVQAKRLELPIRMACYCRHHNEKVGFKALFVVKDHTGQVVSRGSTSSIMITDDHKAAPTKANAGVKRQNHEIEASEEPTFASSVTATPSPKNISDTSFSNPPKKKLSVSKPSIPPSNLAQVPTTTSIFYPSKREYPKKPMGHKPRASKSSTASSPSVIPSNASSPNYQLNIKSPLSPPQPYVYSPPTSLDFNNLGINGNSIHHSQSAQSSPIASPLMSSSNLQMIQPLRCDSTTSNSTSTLMENSIMAPFTSQNNHINNLVPLPEIQKIIPQTGPVRGGIEISLFGLNFVDGLIPKFGDNNAVSTICWSPKSMITHLPPSKCPGPVIVSFEGITMPGANIFSYFDDTDRQLIELALQVVGAKMNGKLEDARDIARRIVGTGTGFDSEISTYASNSTHQNTKNHMASGSNSNSEYSSGIPKDRLEPLLLSLLSLMSSIKNDFSANWQLRNTEGQTMLHLASILGFETLCDILLSNGAHVDVQDRNGYTPLHFAALHDNKNIISQLFEHNADPNVCTYYGKTYKSLLLEGQSDSVQTGSGATESYPASQDMFEFNNASEDSESSEEDDEADEEDDEPDYPVTSFEFEFNNASLEGSDDNTEYDYSEDSNEFEDELENSESCIRTTKVSEHNASTNDGEENVARNPSDSAEAQTDTLANRLGSMFPFFSRTNTVTNESNDTAVPQAEAASNSVYASNMNGYFDVRQWYNYTTANSSSENAPSQMNAFHAGSAMLRSFFDRSGSATPKSENGSESSSHHQQPPPDYYDLFPEGSSRDTNFSSSVIEQEKQHEQHRVQEALDISASEVAPAESQSMSTESENVKANSHVSEPQTEGRKTKTDSDNVAAKDNSQIQPSSDEEVEIWRNNRKKLQNDRMFLFFWLPVFIFILVWVYYNAISYMNRFDSSEGLRLRAERIVKSITASILGFEKYERYQKKAIDAIKAIDRVTTAAVTGVAANVAAAGNVVENMLEQQQVVDEAVAA